MASVSSTYRFCWSVLVVLSSLLILLNCCAHPKLCFCSNKPSCSRSRQGLCFSRTPLQAGHCQSNSDAQPWRSGPVMIKYRAKREQVQQSVVWAACTSCFSFFLLFDIISLFLSALFFPSYLSLSFLLCSSAQIRLWPSQWRVRLWDLRAEQRPENPFHLKSELNKMGEFSWVTSSFLCLLLVENLPLLGRRNWFVLLFKGAKYKLIFVQCVISGTAEEFIQRRSFSCCFSVSALVH